MIETLNGDSFHEAKEGRSGRVLPVLWFGGASVSTLRDSTSELCRETVFTILSKSLGSTNMARACLIPMRCGAHGGEFVGEMTWIWRLEVLRSVNDLNPSNPR